LKYWTAVKAWGRLLAAAGAVLVVLAIPAGASAAPRAHRRHIQVFPASNDGLMFIGERDGYEIAVRFEEPDLAVLQVDKFEEETESFALTNYGAHFQGSLPFGRLRADFGAVGSISVRFRPDGKGRSRKKEGNCTGRARREEDGSFVGRISLHGEGGYFHFAANRVGGTLDRQFRLRCHVKHLQLSYPPESLREAVVPGMTIPFGAGGGGSLASLLVGANEGGREVGLRVDHFAGQREGAAVQLVELEYQGKMPVGRGAAIEQSPPGTFLTTLPGEHPATATLKPPAPFSGKAEYVATSPISHNWTGDLAVQFPGLLQPLTGPEFASTLCVARAFGSRFGCDFTPPDWQWTEE
jgi:hypothetical protein